MKLLEYSNGWGHLIMSIVAIAAGVTLLVTPQDATTKGLGVGLITSVAGYWFVSSSANTATKQVVSQVAPAVEHAVKETLASNTQPLDAQ